MRVGFRQHLRGSRLVRAVVLFSAFVVSLPVWADSPVLTDPKISHGEKSVYRLKKKDGSIDTSTHTVEVASRPAGQIYLIRTDNSVMELLKSNLTPLNIERKDNSGVVEKKIVYSSDRVNIIFPGPKRNKVEKVEENRYDVNTIVYMVRGFPFGQEKKVEFKLVTDDYVLGVRFAMTGEETVTVPAGKFDCYLLEAGLTGMKAAVIRQKIRFWVEKNAPHRLIRQVDEGISDTRLLELQSTSAK